MAGRDSPGRVTGLLPPVGLCPVVGADLTFGSTVLGDGNRPGKVPIWASMAGFSGGVVDAAVLPGGGAPFWDGEPVEDRLLSAGFSGAVEGAVLPGGGAPFWDDEPVEDWPP